MPKKKKTPSSAEHRSTIRYEKRVLDALQPNESYTLRQLYKVLKVADRTAQAAVKAAVLALVKTGQLDRQGSTRYVLTGDTTYVTGQVDHVHASYAYIVTQEGEPDIWVKQANLLGALDKDRVRVRVLHQEGQAGRPVGQVVDIVERNKAPQVGKLTLQGRLAFVIPDGRRMHRDIFIDSKDLKGAQDGDKVMVKITGWPTAQKNPVGKIQKVLGQAGVHEVEMHAIMAEFGLPMHFPRKVLAEAKALPTAIPPRALTQRRDFRAVPTFTIDPEDAKDFDDALSLRELPNGHYEVGIHIADASYYVREDTLLDYEALERGTSVYLVDRTIPMLPEKLSNELCSLRPHEDKLTVSAVFEVDSQGKVHQEWIGETVIHSDRRFTYEGAQQIIADQQGDFCSALTVLNQLAQQLRAQRFRQGAINFETTEVKFQLDEKGRPLRIVPKIRQDTHKLVEEWMLLANQRVATRMYQMKQGASSPTFVYRTHDDPDLEKLDDFFVFAKQLGYKVSRHSSIARSLNTLSAAVAGSLEEGIIQSMAIRTMAKAIYTTEAKGHFGLAFDHYTHFTSPIRRYPDIMVHRLLKQYLQGQGSADAKAYEAKCKHASERERVAADAERASVRYKQVEWLQALQGKAVEGIISGVTDWGIYVEMNAHRCEGMVRLAEMTDDYYELEEKKFRVVGRRSRKTYRLGDQVRVKIKTCDLTKRTVTLRWAE
ncbi:MAG: ribonuclease R [Roseivirga sp.]